MNTTRSFSAVSLALLMAVTLSAQPPEGEAVTEVIAVGSAAVVAIVADLAVTVVAVDLLVAVSADAAGPAVADSAGVVAPAASTQAPSCPDWIATATGSSIRMSSRGPHNS